MARRLPLNMKYSYEELAKMIDHSLLHPTMADRELEDGCRLAAKYQVASVCIKPYAVKRAAELLQGSGVMVGAVIGFPHGNSSTESKRYETELACAMARRKLTWSSTSARPSAEIGITSNAT